MRPPKQDSNSALQYRLRRVEKSLRRTDQDSKRSHFVFELIIICNTSVVFSIFPRFVAEDEVANISVLVNLLAPHANLFVEHDDVLVRDAHRVVPEHNLAEQLFLSVLLLGLCHFVKYWRKVGLRVVFVCDADLIFVLFKQLEHELLATDVALLVLRIQHDLKVPLLSSF